MEERNRPVPIRPAVRDEIDREAFAIDEIVRALASLDEPEQKRVVRYTANRYLRESGQ